jgi:tRNA-splicing endonuclease subunit Sen34
VQRATAKEKDDPYHITPVTSYSLFEIPSPPASTDTELLPPVLASYDLYAHMHSKGYYLSPGLRFGCQYLIYPGDPLRFHSHFLGVGYQWDEEIRMLDIVGGGRLGTGVKKGFLIGGVETIAEEDNDGTGKEGKVRTFCIEWGGM